MIHASTVVIIRRGYDVFLPEDPAGSAPGNWVDQVRAAARGWSHVVTFSPWVDRVFLLPVDVTGWS
jgi:hypothetical protein